MSLVVSTCTQIKSVHLGLGPSERWKQRKGESLWSDAENQIQVQPKGKKKGEEEETLQQSFSTLRGLKKCWRRTFYKFSNIVLKWTKIEWKTSNLFVFLCAKLHSRTAFELSLSNVITFCWQTQNFQTQMCYLIYISKESLPYLENCSKISIRCFRFCEGWIWSCLLI